MLTPEDLKDVLSTLQEAGLEAIIVGGQAVNLWAYHYSLDCPELKEWLPFSSEDLDFFGEEKRQKYLKLMNRLDSVNHPELIAFLHPTAKISP